MGLSLKLGSIDWTKYKIEIFAILLLIAVGFAVWQLYRNKLKFSTE